MLWTNYSDLIAAYRNALAPMDEAAVPRSTIRRLGFTDFDVGNGHTFGKRAAQSVFDGLSSLPRRHACATSRLFAAARRRPCIDYSVVGLRHASKPDGALVHLRRRHQRRNRQRCARPRPFSATVCLRISLARQAFALELADCWLALITGGVNEWSARLPVMLSVLITALLVHRVTRRYASPAASLFAALSFLFCPLLFRN